MLLSADSQLTFAARFVPTAGYVTDHTGADLSGLFLLKKKEIAATAG